MPIYTMQITIEVSDSEPRHAYHLAAKALKLKDKRLLGEHGVIWIDSEIVGSRPDDDEPSDEGGGHV